MRMVTASVIIMSMVRSPATARVLAKAMVKAMVKDMDRATAITATGKVTVMAMVRVAGVRSN